MGLTVLVLIVDAEVAGSLEPRVSVVRDGDLSLLNFFERGIVVER